VPPTRIRSSTTQNDARDVRSICDAAHVTVQLGLELQQRGPHRKPVAMLCDCKHSMDADQLFIGADFRFEVYRGKVELDS